MLPLYIYNFSKTCCKHDCPIWALTNYYYYKPNNYIRIYIYKIIYFSYNIKIK